MSEDLKQVQLALNAFTNRYLDRVPPIRVDGAPGTATSERIKMVKFYLGYLAPKVGLSDDLTTGFRSRLHHPRSPRYSSPVRLARAAQRRIQQRKDSRAHVARLRTQADVVMVDGVPVASWMVKYVWFARERGWPGWVVSGFRDPEYSKRLCLRLCGRPSCPGTCAGLSSNHVGKIKPKGALDLTHYKEFGEIMQTCPYEPRLINRLPRDRVHYSASGN